MRPAKDIINIKQVLILNKEACGVLSFSATLVITSKSKDCFPCTGFPNKRSDASRTCLTKLLSVGEEIPAISCAHLTA